MQALQNLMEAQKNAQKEQEEQQQQQESSKEIPGTWVDPVSGKRFFSTQVVNRHHKHPEYIEVGQHPPPPSQPKPAPSPSDRLRGSGGGKSSTFVQQYPDFLH